MSYIPAAFAADVQDPNAPEQAKTILADQIRDQGKTCVRVEDAHRDEELSKPDGPVQQCRLPRGNMSAEIEVLDSDP